MIPRRGTTNILEFIIIIIILVVAIWFIYTINQDEMKTESYVVKSVPIVRNDMENLKDLKEYEATKEAESAINYLNNIRKQFLKNEINFDERVYKLAGARLNDMVNYNYFEHTNPYTRECADSMKNNFEINNYEYVAENIFAYINNNENDEEIWRTAINNWLRSESHKINLLYDHTSGAIACSENMCVFLGLNQNGYGEGCYNANNGQ